jgi:hypothetical protein
MDNYEWLLFLSKYLSPEILLHLALLQVIGSILLKYVFEPKAPTEPTSSRGDR